MEINEIIYQLIGALILIYILKLVLKILDLEVAVSSFFIIISIAAVILWLFKELNMI